MALHGSKVRFFYANFLLVSKTKSNFLSNRPFVLTPDFSYFCGMQRYRIDLSYNGKDFFGWQRQPRQISVQEKIEDAFSKLNGNVPISVVGCGRTDTGVHAQFYTLHVDLEDTFPLPDAVYKLNKILPQSIVIQEIQAVSSIFHARFDATSRSYRYFLRTKKDAFKNDFSLYFPHALNIEAMNEACDYLLGKQDFTSFSKLHTDVKTNICTIYHAQWVEVDASSYYFEIKADRFLRNMVRAIVGTLLEVGQGKIRPVDMLEIIKKKNRSEAKISVPANGLFLWNVEYLESKK
jgi:tRNA pseudouridine38-40 synthase